MHKLGSIYW